MLILELYELNFWNCVYITMLNEVNIIKTQYLFLFYLFILVACDKTPELEFIHLVEKNTAEVFVEEENDATVKVAFASVVSPEETRYKYELLIKYIERKIDKPITVIQRQTYDEINQLLKDGDVDLAFICSLSYVIGKEEGYVLDIATTKINGNDHYQAYIITHINSDIYSIEDLRGKNFAFVDPYSYSGKLALLGMLDDYGYSEDTFFDETFYTYSHDYSVKAVARGAVDAATVDGITFDMLVEIENEDAKQIRVIDKGPLAGAPPIVVSHKIDPNLKKELKDLILSLKDDPAGKIILQELMIEEFVVINQENYEPIRNVLNLMGE
ncbi:phosphate/phosphite/phosphonate ABC transporter substrate-binding protein [Anaerobacillus sp. CMMVII]|uniref:substrate-binding domain-containing protein n=1 Tax=Anaerobacillus sp. CMMVII TaxID=2755588 RepID=UPI0021B71A0C|nr:phosphate/phosphite/phosphonate ABC transporter substrate-binding protein [Anaerobacillus sp. CMMVII]MCT8137022.1 phosphate/phosphite/phosphonate ABC transporter substrate-binding protein [Anaerobacillus sp. CMMVII]